MRRKLEIHPETPAGLQFEGTSETATFTIFKENAINFRDSWNACRDLVLTPGLNLEAVLRSALPVIEDAEQAVLLQVVGAAPDIQARLRDVACRYRAQADEIRVIINLPRQA